MDAPQASDVKCKRCGFSVISTDDELICRVCAWKEAREKPAAAKTPAPATAKPAAAAQIKRMVDDYCSRTISMNKLITDAKRWQLVWGAVDITKMQLERNRPAALMAFGASDGEAFVVVGEDCAYNAMAYSVFFERLTAPEGQPVFVRTAAVVALNADGRIEPRHDGILEIRG